MKTLLTIIAVIAGIGCTIWFLTIGGIVQAVASGTATPVHAVGLAVGIVRFFLTSLGIWVSITVPVFLRVLAEDP